MNTFEGWENVTPDQIIYPKYFDVLRLLHDQYKFEYYFPIASVVTPFTDEQLKFLCSKCKLVEGLESRSTFNTHHMLFNLLNNHSTGYCCPLFYECRLTKPHFKWQCSKFQQIFQTETRDIIKTLPQPLYYIAWKNKAQIPPSLKLNSKNYLLIFINKNSCELYIKSWAQIFNNNHDFHELKVMTAEQVLIHDYLVILEDITHDSATINIAITLCNSYN